VAKVQGQRTMASSRCFSKKEKVNSFLPSVTPNRFCARSYRPPFVLKVDMPGAHITAELSVYYLEAMM
jgi:hypothetical protein